MENPNNTYNILHNVIQDANNNHMPSKLVKYNKYKLKRYERYLWNNQIYNLQR